MRETIFNWMALAFFGVIILVVAVLGSGLAIALWRWALS